MKLPLVLFLSAMTAPALGDTLTRIRIDAPNARGLAARLEHAGYDVLEGSVRDGSLEVVASPKSREDLKAMRLQITVVQVGRPYSEIQGDVPGGYLNLAQITAQLNARAASFPGICQIVDLTATYGTPATAEGRHMMAAKITGNI